MKRALHAGIATLLVAGVAAATSMVGSVAAAGSIGLTTQGVAYTQDFDTLASAPDNTEATAVPDGWDFAESGTNANTSYRISAGVQTNGDTYSFGASASSERAFGGLRSGTNVPLVGASFTNQTGAAISALRIAYTAEQWRLGQNTTGRAADRLDFQLSTNATSLTTGTWADVNALDVLSPVVTGTVGALNGNVAPNRVALTTVLTGLSIPNGTTFWIRWVDSDLIPGSDDGLAVDDFSLTPNPAGVSVSDVSLAEGDSGSTTFDFTVSVPQPAGAGGVTFDVATQDGSATVATNDYAALVGSGMIAPGATSTTVSVTVNGDTAVEGDEMFLVNLTNVVGATVTDPQGQGTIVNDDPLEIATIQGPGHLSPFTGARVLVAPSIITAVRRGAGGFWMQDPTPDADPATSDGIFVFTSSATTVAVGDLVQVTGTVAEFGSSPNLTLTELTSPTVTVLSSGNAVPDAVVVGAGGLVPPTEVIDDDSATRIDVTGPSGSFDPTTDGIDFWETLEGVRVELHDVTATGPTADFGSNSEIPVVGAGAGLRTPTGGVIVQPGDFNPERLILNDVVAGTPRLPAVDVGVSIAGVTVGVLDYGFGNFRLQVTSLGTVTASPIVREVASEPGPDELAIASFNVENLDPGDGAAKFDELAHLIVDNLRAPDLVALEEVQDDNGPTNNGVVTANVTLDTLVAAIEAAGGPTYDYRQIDPLDGTSGGEPGGNIRQAFLFRTDRGLAFVDRPGGDATTAVTVVTGANGPELSVSPGRLDPTNTAFTASRKPLAGEFTYDGRTLFVVANHFNSKGGDEPLFGRFQPPSLVSEVQRLQQAAVVAGFVEQLRTADPDAAVVVLGDINDFEFSAPMQVLKDADLTPLIETLDPAERYTYVFQGNSQALDHILFSPWLLARPFELDSVHVNAEFAAQASDHDPQLVHVSINRTPTVDAGGPYAGVEGTAVTVSATGTDPDGDALTYAWDLDGDGTFETAGQSVSVTAPPAPTTITIGVQVTDTGGKTATDTATVKGLYDWSGFLGPIDELPTANTVKAGQGIPIKFSLDGDQGLAVLAAGSPTSQQVACTTGESDPVEETSAAGSSSLTYDAATDTYTYVWKTEKGWATTCRLLTVTLADGTTHQALFRFTR